MFGFQIIQIFRNTTNSFFSGQMSLTIIAELLKNAPMFHGYGRNNLCPIRALLRTVLYFLSALSRGNIDKLGIRFQSKPTHSC